MAKRKRKPDAGTRTDTLAALVKKARKGDGAELLEEMDAILGFLRMYEDDYAKEDNPGMAFLVGLVSDLARIVGLWIGSAPPAS